MINHEKEILIVRILKLRTYLNEVHRLCKIVKLFCHIKGINDIVSRLTLSEFYCPTEGHGQGFQICEIFFHISKLDLT